MCVCVCDIRGKNQAVNSERYCFDVSVWQDVFSLSLSLFLFHTSSFAQSVNAFAYSFVCSYRRHHGISNAMHTKMPAKWECHINSTNVNKAEKLWAKSNYSLQLLLSLMHLWNLKVFYTILSICSPGATWFNLLHAFIVHMHISRAMRAPLRINLMFSLAENSNFH